MVLLQWADRPEKRPELAALLTQENGKVLARSRGEMKSRARRRSATLREAAGVAGLIFQ